jgi:hypothetical protein
LGYKFQGKLRFGLTQTKRLDITFWKLSGIIQNCWMLYDVMAFVPSVCSASARHKWRQTLI